MNQTIGGVFFCSGARNFKLLPRLSKETLYYEVDERTASFKALGLCKALKKPVIICTTSGTAVSECLSAMVEAFYSEAPLILISADRPKELQGSGAPQTIDHEIITRNHRREYLEIGIEDFETFDFTNRSYPLHLNVLVRSKDEISTGPKPPHFDSFASFLKVADSPCFLFSHGPSDMRDFVERFSTLELPFYAETLSGAHDLSVIKTEKALLRMLQSSTFNGVVRVGHTPLSKAWRILEGMDLPVYSFDPRGLLALSHGSVERSEVGQLLCDESWWNSLETIRKSSISDETRNLLWELIRTYPEAEVSYFNKLQAEIPKDALVYIGNSQPIRYFELVQEKRFRMHANRGANGIDGQLASATGLALSTSENVYCILGDLTLTYDLSSLRDLPSNLHVIVINNGGGRIFETLKIDQRLVMEHDRNFKALAQGFGLSYSTTIKDIHLSQVTELFPDIYQSREFNQRWAQ